MTTKTVKKLDRALKRIFGARYGVHYMNYFPREIESTHYLKRAADIAADEYDTCGEGGYWEVEEL